MQLAPSCEPRCPLNWAMKHTCDADVDLKDDSGIQKSQFVVENL